MVSALSFWQLCAIKKRKYANLKGKFKIDDNFVENINEFYDSKKKHKASSDEPRAIIHNLVGTARIESSITNFNLEMISRILPNPVYDKQKFAAITIRIHSPMCTVLLFTSGKMVLTGCRNFAECCQASLEIVQILRGGLPGVVMQLTEVRIQNIVGNVDLKLDNRVLDLDRFYYDQSVYSTYQKNMFPGLIFRPNNSPVVLLMFSSGKVVITGGKASRDIYDGWTALWPLVKQYIKNSD